MAIYFPAGEELGIGFHLLSGGEPLLRRDVITAAAGYPGTAFPVFTNGTMLDRAYLELFDRSRNLIPVLSIEENETETDGRRGKGIYQTLLKKMEELRRRKLLFGVSVTVTAKNLECVSSRDFLNHLEQLGCRVVLFIEYVPVDPATRNLAFSAVERECLAARQEKLRKAYPSVLFLSFPGDEVKVGGCLAAGRGFFHIGPYGDAEPCPFSPYSDFSLKGHTLLEALDSPFFTGFKAKDWSGPSTTVIALCLNRKKG